MLRKLRVEFSGAIYHVLSREDRGEDIFKNVVGRQDFLKTLAEVRQKTGFEVHAGGPIAVGTWDWRGHGGGARGV